MLSPFRQRLAMAWTALRRAHKDSRARRQLGRLSLVVLLPLVFLLYLAFVFLNGWAGVIGFGAGLVAIALVTSYRKRRPAEQSGPLTLTLTELVVIPDQPPLHAGPELRRELAERALLHAILAHRAASEAFLKHKDTPADREVITRQLHVRLLRDHTMVDRLRRTERDLILLPDGAWDEDTVERASLLLEPLRVMRWLLQVDPLLPEIGNAALLDFSLASSFVQEPQHAFESPALVEMEDIRTARFAAEQMFYRAYAEGLRRGFYTVDDPQQADAALFYAQRVAGFEDKDFLLGPTIVGKASDDTVRLACTLALGRARLLRWMQERLYGTVPAEPEITAFGWQ